ncbi:MAG: U32 family peptidase [Bacteroidales bacterium]|nr:U32 family peptidase [Bacteroidales bacterium]
MSQPELLLPAGNIEAFHAAVEGGADAVYLGLKNFNARERADNFTPDQFQTLLQEAEKRGIKVYLTLNIVIKNDELSGLLDTLYMLSQTSVSAVIIQDWGVYDLIRLHFPKLKVHASTQMGNHNSLGAIYSDKLGFERVIFARELTTKEISAIRNKSRVQVEMFVHGALCYSFSGMCLFSSYLGGMSANRGRCMQPCRRMYGDTGEKKYLFSLKDNELIDHIPTILKLGISSLKIEGRLKPAEYVYRVAKAYRMAIDDPSKIDQAKKLLKYDMGRPKTSYFFGGDVGEAITNNPSTGIFLGHVKEVQPHSFSFASREPLHQGNRLWIRSPKGGNRKAIKIKSLEKGSDNHVTLHESTEKIHKGDLVYLANLRDKKFPNRFERQVKGIKPHMPGSPKKDNLQGVLKPQKPGKTQIFARIDSIKWLKKIPMQEIDNLILNLSEQEWRELDVSTFLIKKNAHKIFFELPRFIPENKIGFYRSLFHGFREQGYHNFMISHLSQKIIIPKASTIASNEHVYTFNDAAIHHLRGENIKLFAYPLENDLDNLFSMQDKKGIVPMYFYPELFYSRMPVKIRNPHHSFRDDKNYEFTRLKRNGMTIVVPREPVSLTQYKGKLEAEGFGRFLIDMSYEKPSDKRFHTVLKNLKDAQQIQPSSTFNVKMGLT